MTRILVVEDSPTQAEHVRQVLDAEGFEVVCAGDAAAAQKALAGADFDLVLTDVTMPGVLDGVGLLRRLRADTATATLPVVVLSARTDEEARVEGLAAGADDYIMKPFAPRELLARIEGAIRMARLRREVALREQELEIARARVKLSLALDAARMGEVIYDLARDELTHTPGFAALLGLPAGRVLTLDEIRAGFHPEDREDALGLAGARRTNREQLDFEHRVVWPDGSERWLSGRSRISRDPDGEPAELIAVYMDVTERRVAQLRIARLQAEVAHAGRLSELGRMSSVIAHELNQPLAAAATFLGAGERIAQLEPLDPNRLNEVLAKAGAQIARAGQILQRVRGFGAKGEGTRVATDLAALVKEAAEVARLDPRTRGAELRVDLQADLPAPVVDRVQIQQVLLNLLRNAFEAVDRCSDQVIEVSATLKTEGLEVRVADSGPGLDPEIMPRLFEPFVTTKPDGMGVGLSVCRDIVESHGGRLWADPTGGPGAVFRFTLPLEQIVAA